MISSFGLRRPSIAVLAAAAIVVPATVQLALASPAAAELPEGEAAIAAFDTTVGGTHRIDVAYPDNTGVVRVLTFVNGAWTYATPNATAYAWPPVSGFVSENPATSRIESVGFSQHILEAYNTTGDGSWRTADLTSMFNAAPACTSPFGFASHYRTLFGYWRPITRVEYGACLTDPNADPTVTQLHELQNTGGAWVDANLTQQYGAPYICTGNPSAAEDAALNPHIFYGSCITSSSPSALVDFAHVGLQWTTTVLSQLSYGVAFCGHRASAARTVNPNTFRVEYRGCDGHIHEAYDPGDGWHGADLTAWFGGGYACGDPVVRQTYQPTVARIIYTGCDGWLYELTNTGGPWMVQRVNAIAGVPSACNGPDLVQSSTDYTVHFLFSSCADGHLWDVQTTSQGSVVPVDLTALTGAPPSYFG
jgi:hypothetical protein